MARAQRSILSTTGGDVAAAEQEFFRRGGPMARKVQRLQAAGQTAKAQSLTRHAVGKEFKGRFGDVGKIVSKLAPFASLIPGVGVPLAAGIGAAGSFAGGGDFGDVLKGAAIGGGGAALLGGQGFKGVPGAFGKLGRLAKGAFTTPEGKLDLERLLGTAGAVSQFAGQRKQGAETQRANDQAMALRNMLMQRILERPTYNFTPGQ